MVDHAHGMMVKQMPEGFLLVDFQAGRKGARSREQMRQVGTRMQFSDEEYNVAALYAKSMDRLLATAGDLYQMDWQVMPTA